MGVICTRWGCGHTKRDHDDPLMEGMCAHDGCQCLGFTTVKRAGSAPHQPAPKPAPKPAVAKPGQTPVQTPAPLSPEDRRHRQAIAESYAQEVVDKTWPGNNGERLDHDPRHGRIDKDIQEHVADMRPESSAQRVAIENTLQEKRDRGRTVLGVTRAPVVEPEPAPAPAAPASTEPVVVAPPTGEPAATEKVAPPDPCPAICPHCGKTCSGKAGHGPNHFRRGRGGHTWVEAAAQPEPEPEPEPEQFGEVIDLETERAKVDAVVAEVAQSLAVDEPERVLGLDTPRTVEIETEVQTPVEIVAAPPSTPVDEPVDEAKPVDERYVLAHLKHPDGTKRCPNCTEMRTVEEFSPTKSSYDGLHGWCKRCVASRKQPINLARSIRNRARHRASAELIAAHRDEFREIYHRMVDEVRAEADLLADDELAKEIYGEDHPRLRPGRRQEGETALERIDVARCPDCHRWHDQGHVCEVCGSTPEHRHVTQSAWSKTQEALRARMRGEEATSE